jgi:predicted acylesterase/phospholipase RssA
MNLEKKPFEAVVISGGGVKGILSLGVLHYYYESGLYNPHEISEYSGTSIGSAISLLLICGYLPMEIFKEIYSAENFFTIGDCYSICDIFKYMGLMSIDPMINFIGDLVKRKLGCIPTLGKLKEMTGKRLCTSGANVTNISEEIYTPETHPNLGALQAVTISCNLPLIFQRLKYRDSFVIDGGLINNFPWDYISEGLHTLGVLIEVGNDCSFPDDEFLGYVYRTMMIPATILSELRCQMASPNINIVKVRWKGGTVLQFNMDPDVKMDMFLSGYKAGEEAEKTKYIIVEGWNFIKAGYKIEKNLDDEIL